MDKQRDKAIKDVLKKYPELAGVLKKYDINCFTCDGNCDMKNITEEHNLSMKEEMTLKKEMKCIMDKSK